MQYRLVYLHEKLSIFTVSCNIQEITEKYQFFHCNAIPFDVLHWKITEIFKIIRIWWKIYHFKALFTSNAMKYIFFNIIKVKNPCFSSFQCIWYISSLLLFTNRIQNRMLRNFMTVCANVQIGLYQFFTLKSYWDKVNTPIWYQTKNNGKFSDNSYWRKRPLSSLYANEISPAHHMITDRGGFLK